MDVDALLQGGGLIIGGAALAKLLDFASKMWSARHQKTEIAPQPLEVSMAHRFRTCEECDRRHAEVDKRLEDGTKMFESIHRDMQSGFQRITDRISPVAEACAANSAAIQILLKHHPGPQP